MSPEEHIKESLIKKFGYTQDSIRVTRARRIFMEVSRDDFRKVFEYAVRDLKFPGLAALTGLDEVERFAAIYHLSNGNGIVLSIKTGIEKAKPVIKTITGIFPSADVYERELADLFGIKVEGLAPGNRYPLTDDWPKDEFPLRKDWKPKA